MAQRQRFVGVTAPVGEARAPPTALDETGAIGADPENPRAIAETGADAAACEVAGTRQQVGIVDAIDQVARLGIQTKAIDPATVSADPQLAFLAVADRRHVPTRTAVEVADAVQMSAPLVQPLQPTAATDPDSTERVTMKRRHLVVGEAELIVRIVKAVQEPAVA